MFYPHICTKPLKYISYTLVILIPGLFIILFTIKFGTNVMRWDEFTFAIAQSNGDLFLDNFSVVKNYLFKHHNEHLIFFPSVVYWLIGRMTNFNSVAQMIISNSSLLVLYYAISFVFIKYKGRTSCFTYLISNFILAGIILNLSQYDNLLWAFQLGFNLTFVFSIFAILFFTLFIEYNKTYSFIISIIFCILASLSSSQGLLSWIVLLLMYIPKRSNIFNIKGKVLLYLVCLSITFFVFFVSYIHPKHHPSIFFGFNHPILFITYYLKSLGGIAGAGTKANIMGVILLLFSIFAIIYFFKTKKNLSSLFYFSIGCTIYGLFSTGLISLGRSGFGIEQASSSRYVTFTMSVAIGLFCNCKLFGTPT